MDCLCKCIEAWAAASSCFAGAIRWKQQISSSAGELELDTLRELTAVGDVGKFCTVQVAGGVGGIQGVDPVCGGSGINHLRDGCPAGFPVPSDVRDLVTYLVGAMKCNYEICLR